MQERAVGDESRDAAGASRSDARARCRLAPASIASAGAGRRLLEHLHLADQTWHRRSRRTRSISAGRPTRSLRGADRSLELTNQTYSPRASRRPLFMASYRPVSALRRSGAAGDVSGDHASVPSVEKPSTTRCSTLRTERQHRQRIAACSPIVEAEFRRPSRSTAAVCPQSVPSRSGTSTCRSHSW